MCRVSDAIGDANYSQASHGGARTPVADSGTAGGTAPPASEHLVVKMSPPVRQHLSMLLYDRRNTVHRVVNRRTPGQAVRKALRTNQLCWIDEIDHTVFTSFCDTCVAHGTPADREYTPDYTASCRG